LFLTKSWHSKLRALNTSNKSNVIDFNTDEQTRKTLGGVVFVISGEVIKSNGEGFHTVDHTFAIGYFDGVTKLEELPGTHLIAFHYNLLYEVRELSEADEKELVARGELFNKLGVGAHYLNYVGMI
jgi:hypothetical protein